MKDLCEALHYPLIQLPHPRQLFDQTKRDMLAQMGYDRDESTHYSIVEQ